MKLFYLMITSLLLFACNQDEEINPLDGKIKTLELIYTNLSDVEFFQFTYNSSGYLMGMENDSLKFLISEKVNNVTTIIIETTSADPLFTGRFYYKVFTNNANQILSIKKVDTVTMEASEHYYLSYNNNKIDSIVAKGSTFLMSNLTSFAYQFNNNYTKKKGAWHVWTGFMGVDCTDTTVYTYTSLANTGFVPLQIPCDVSSALYGYPTENFLFYLMGLNGAHALNQNQNLVQSISSYVYPSMLGPAENYITNFNYLQNTSGQVIEMQVSNPDGTGIFMIYKLTYY